MVSFQSYELIMENGPFTDDLHEFPYLYPFNVEKFSTLKNHQPHPSPAPAPPSATCSPPSCPCPPPHSTWSTWSTSAPSPKPRAAPWPWPTWPTSTGQDPVSLTAAVGTDTRRNVRKNIKNCHVHGKILFFLMGH